MVKKRIIPLLLLGLVLSTTGCSGSRLRNMFGRSDYSALEDLEPQDSAEAKYASADRADDEKRKDVLVSQERDVDDSADAEKRRKGFFDFAKVFNRKSEDEEFAPDPFSEPEKPTVVKKTTPTPIVAKTEFQLDKESGPSKVVDDYSEKIAAIEKNTAKLFADINESPKPTLFETETKTASTNDSQSPAQAADDSFDDYINRSSTDSAKTAAKTVSHSKELAAEKAEAFIAATEQASDFDALLNNSALTDETSEAKTEVAADSDLFAETNADFLNSFGPSPEESREDVASNEQREVVARTADGSPFGAEIESPFAETADKHGFHSTGRKDPWAAFDHRQDSAAVSNPADDPKVDEDFSWGNQPEPATAAAAAFASLANNAGTNASQDNAVSNPFLQISSTQVAGPREPIDISESMPLMIPGGSDPNSAFESSHQFTTHATEDPFLTSVPVFTESAEPQVVVNSENAAAAAVAPAAASAGIGQWSRRTWFLLIGCIIVALLLFMPDRHNRTNV